MIWLCLQGQVVKETLASDFVTKVLLCAIILVAEQCHLHESGAEL